MKILFMLSLMISFSAQAASIQKWVDDKGQVHYGDQPPQQSQTTAISVDAAPSNPGPSLPRLNANADAEQEANPADAETDATANAEPEVPADQAAAACEKANKDLDIIKRSSRIRTTDSEGNSHYMTTEEIKARRERTEADIEQFCP